MAKEAPTRERKQAEEALRDSEQQFQNAFEHASIGMALVSTGGRILEVNRSFREMLGYSDKEFIAMTWKDITHPDDLDTGMEQMRQMLDGEIQSCNFEKRYIHKHGREVRAQLSASLVRDRNGKPLHFVSQIQDITERKQAEEALWISRVLLEKTFASLKEAVFVVDPNTRKIIACNSAAERIFGYSEKEMIGHNTEFLHVDQASYADFGRQLYPALDENGVFHCEYRVRRKNGNIFFSDHTVTEIVDDTGRRTGLVSVVRDISEKKRMEEALQAARDELEGKVERQLLRRNPYGLTFRELTVLHLVAAGESDKQIGLKLGISHFTAQKHTSNILAKMGAGSRTEATARALREGLLD